MDILTPDETTTGLSKLGDALQKLDKKFRQEKNDYNHYELTIIGEYYNTFVCDEIKKIYTEAGWCNVKCGCSLEEINGGEYCNYCLILTIDRPNESKITEKYAENLIKIGVYDNTTDNNDSDKFNGTILIALFIIIIVCMYSVF